MALLPILRYPDARLHKVAKPVTEFDDRLKKLVADMAETMYDAPGIGLAANQVNILNRVLVMDRGALVADETPHALLAGAGGAVAQRLASVPREQAERLAANLNELAVNVGLADDFVKAHHGSLAREQRILIEDQLKSGKLRGIGFSAYIDGAGRIVAQGPRRAEGTIVTEVPLEDRASFYLASGDWPAGLCLLACVGCALAGIRQRRQASREPAAA